MKDNFEKNKGAKQLLKKYRKSFRIPENLDFYSEEDFKIAERKFLKYLIQRGNIKTPSFDYSENNIN